MAKLPGWVDAGDEAHIEKPLELNGGTGEANGVEGGEAVRRMDGRTEDGKGKP
jgi:hypothetical protein